jgi:outer membrane receptor protein involved in Fe transport
MQHAVDGWRIDLIGAGQEKEFGAQGYYGIPSTFYAEQRTEDVLLYAGAAKGEPDDAFFRAGAAWRAFDDELRGPAPFAHDVRSRYVTAMLEGRTLEIQHIALTLRGNVEYEQVEGTTGSRDRTRGSMLLLPEARFERFILKAGLNSVVQTAESAEFLPVAGIDWLAADNSTLYATYHETVRQPDYQTLQNNAALQQQKSENSELGVRHFFSEHMDGHAALFHRRLQHASDWLGGTAATDLGTLNVTGAEAMLRFYPSGALKLELFYQWTHKDNDRSDGFYELDYPEQLLNLAAYWKFMNAAALEFAQTTRYQTDNDLRTGSDFGADASLGLHYFPRFAENARLTFRVDNLWGSDFQVFPGLKPRSTGLYAGMTVTW